MSPASRARPWLRLGSPAIEWLVLGLFVTGSLVGWRVWTDDIERERRAEFTAEADAGMRDILDQLHHHGDLLRATAGLFEGSTSVDEDDFARFVSAQRLPARFPTLRGLVYVAEQADGRAMVTYGHWTRGPSVIGLDVAASPVARAAMLRATSLGDVVMSGPIGLPNDPQRTGFALFVPVRDGGATRGWIAASFPRDEFLSASFDDSPGEAGFAMYAGEATAGTPIAATGDVPVESAAFFRSASFDVLGGRWTIVAGAPRGAYQHGGNAAATVLLLGGLLVGGLLFIVLRLLCRGEARARAMAAEATATLRESEQLFRTLSDASPTGIFRLAQDGTITYINPRLLALTGLSSEGLVVGQSALPVHPDDLDRVAETWNRAQHEPGVALRMRIVRPDGQVRWVAASTAAIRDAGTGMSSGYVGTIDDITHQVRSEERTSRLTAIIEATSDLVVISDADGRTVYANDAAHRSLDLPYGVVRTPADSYPPHASVFFEEHVVPALLAQGMWSGETEMLDRYGEVIPVSQVLIAHCDGDGRLQHVSAISRDMTERRQVEQQLADSNLRDQLTSLANRVLFVDRVELALARSGGHRASVAVAFVDLDRFKLVNDSLGHEVGDCLLQEVAQRLGGVLRDKDTAGRFSGDEFVVLCEDVTTEGDALRIVERLRSAFAAPFLVDGSELHVTAGIGIAVATDVHQRAEHLLRDAHVALSRAKERGGGQVELFDERLRARAMARMDIERELHRAVEAGELRVHYQPEISLTDGSVVGLEALVRWEHPVRGLMPPGEFVPVAEQSGLIDAVGHFVLAEACWQAARWRRTYADLTVWVNVSPRQLARPDFIQRVAYTLAETGAPEGSVGLEITESLLIEDHEGALRQLTGLRDLGLRLAVDDFGTGYSSLTYLRRLPVEMVKIDRSFIEGLGGDNAVAVESGAIVAAVVSMARALGLTAVAEGAETAAHVAALAGLGCDVAQGFYFARPAPPQAVDVLLRTEPLPWLALPAATVAVPAQRTGQQAYAPFGRTR